MTACRARASAGALLAQTCTFAAAALPTVPAPVPIESSGGGMLQAVFGMALVLGLIFLLAWLARRFGLQRLGGSGVVKVVTSAPIGPRERVVVIEVGGTWLVLGATPTQVNTLHAMPAQSAPARPGAVDLSPGVLGMFSSKLREALGTRDASA